MLVEWKFDYIDFYEIELIISRKKRWLNKSFNIK